MTKIEFIEFYDHVVKILGTRFANEYQEFEFCDNPSSLYEEYLNQKTMLRILYGKESNPEKKLLERPTFALVSFVSGVFVCIC